MPFGCYRSQVAVEHGDCQVSKFLAARVVFDRGAGVAENFVETFERLLLDAMLIGKRLGSDSGSQFSQELMGRFLIGRRIGIGGCGGGVLVGTHTGSMLGAGCAEFDVVESC